MNIDFGKLKSVIKEIEEEKQSGDGWVAWSRLCLWLAQYEAAQQSVQADGALCPICDFEQKIDQVCEEHGVYKITSLH